MPKSMPPARTTEPVPLVLPTGGQPGVQATYLMAVPVTLASEPLATPGRVLRMGA